MILGFFRPDSRPAVETLYRRIAAASRHPALYLHLGVPDTLEGRFEALTLHMVLVLRALRRLPAPANEVAQELVDLMFRQLDVSLREMGVGDTMVPKRMKTLAQAFYGRAQAYDSALESPDRSKLAETLGRNIREGGRPAEGLARYVMASEADLGASRLDRLLNEGPAFPPPEKSVEEGAS